MPSNYNKKKKKVTKLTEIQQKQTLKERMRSQIHVWNCNQCLRQIGMEILFSDFFDQFFSNNFISNPKKYSWSKKKKKKLKKKNNVTDTVLFSFAFLKKYIFFDVYDHHPFTHETTDLVAFYVMMDEILLFLMKPVCMELVSGWVSEWHSRLISIKVNM